MPSTRRIARACEDTSRTLARQPRSTISRSICWTSGASGVVRSAAFTSFSPGPVLYATVPSIPHRMPAASNIDTSRYAVVVFPFVPVIPTTRMSPLGCRKNVSARTARASRASVAVAHATCAPSGAAVSETTATAPRSSAWRTNAVPSACWPLSATNTLPGLTTRESYAMPVTGRSDAPSGSSVRASPWARSARRKCDQVMGAPMPLSASDAPPIDRARAGTPCRVRAAHPPADPARRQRRHPTAARSVPLS